MRWSSDELKNEQIFGNMIRDSKKKKKIPQMLEKCQEKLKTILKNEQGPYVCLHRHVI